MAQNELAIEEALTSYDRHSDQTAIELAEKERVELVRQFPLDAWPHLTLERYALGLENKRESFSWWMEWGTEHVGSMKGGSARKHIIYRQNDGSWYYDHQRFQNEQDAWKAVRTGFIEAFQKAKEGDWTTIDQIESISTGPALRTKTLHCYFPNDLLPISSLAHIRHFLHKLGNTEADAPGYEVVRLNRILLETLRGRPECGDWTTQELTRFLYHWSDPREQRKIIKIAPGEDARFWQDCLDGGYICVGWDAVGDLRQFESKDAFRSRFEEANLERYNNSQSAVSRKANEVWTLRELEPGDLIVANKGTSRVLAVGTVVEPGYDWRDDRPEYKHIVTVDWDTSYAKNIPTQKTWATTTIKAVGQWLAAQILQKDGTTRPPTPTRMLPIPPIFSSIESALDRKGQVVLYGPPGTGKTFWARRFAVWWLLKKLGLDSTAALGSGEEFLRCETSLSTAQATRRAWFVVANPKQWSWDELFKNGHEVFKYGRLHRNFPLAQKGDLVFGYQSSPDKRIVALAVVAREMHSSTNGEQQIALEPIAPIEQGLSYEELQQDELLRHSEPIRFRCQGTLFAVTEEEFDQLASLILEHAPGLRQHLEGVQSAGHLTRLTFHASYSYEDFIEGFRPVASSTGQLALRLEDGVFKRICREAQANPAKPYLVVIDEVNRANVAKVFGELITLLELDKRGMLVSLPQSKESFTIPSNVYLLGTMNTADRSIKLLDAALRRRFAFLEMMPDSSLLRGGKVGNLALDEFLDELNRRVAEKEGREKQIGHSYLMEGEEAITDPSEFARRFSQEILPLLQEYCYEDYAVLADYIGDGLVNRDAQTLDEEKLADPDLLIESLEHVFGEAKAAE